MDTVFKKFDSDNLKPFKIKVIRVNFLFWWVSQNVIVAISVSFN